VLQALTDSVLDNVRKQYAVSELRRRPVDRHVVGTSLSDNQWPHHTRRYTVTQSNHADLFI